MKKLNMIGSGAIALPIQVSTFGRVQGSGVSAVRKSTRGGEAAFGQIAFGDTTLGYTGRLRGTGDAPAPDSVLSGALS